MDRHAIKVAQAVDTHAWIAFSFVYIYAYAMPDIENYVCSLRPYVNNAFLADAPRENEKALFQCKMFMVFVKNTVCTHELYYDKNTGESYHEFTIQ